MNLFDNMKRCLRNALPAAAALAVAAACTDLSDLEQRMDNLEAQVAAIEAQVNVLNANVEATAALMQAGTIYKAENKDGVWTLTLSDGTVITLTEGSVGVGNTPVMSIDSDGYWMVDYGSGKQYVLNNGEKVKATGADGVTPLFGVNASGNWTVSYDGGATYTEVLDSNGSAVSALPDSSGTVNDPYFSSVSYEGGVFTLVLKDGTSLSVPVVSDFLCSIAGAETLQVFAPGETKTFAVTLQGVSQTIVSAPYGWEASLGESILSVTAPASTKATLADTRTDVSILALSGSGYAVSAKVRVQVDGSAVTVSPTAAITAGEVGETSVSFTVTLSDADSWKYIVRKADEAAPSPEYVSESGTAGEGSGATVSGLDEGTEYTIYVLPLSGTVAGSLAKLTVTTAVAEITDWYQAYIDGKEIEIAGVKYSQALNGEATLLSADAAATNLRTQIHQKSVVLFLEQADGAYFDIPSVTEITGDVVLVSRYTDKPVTVRPTMCMKLKSGSLVLKNIIWDMVNIAGGTNATYTCNNANATADFTRWHIDGCQIINVTKPLLYANVAGYGCQSLKVVDSVIQLAYASGNVQLFNFYKSTVLNVYKELAFDNNVVYNAKACAAVQIFNYDQNVAQTGSPWEAGLSVRNNIFYNCPSGNGYFKFYQLASLRMNGNVFWGDPASTLSSYGFILYSESQDASVVDASGNIAYGLATGGNWLLAHTNSKVVPSDNTLTKLEESPFESFSTSDGSYVLKAAYSAYGPQ